MKKKIWIDCDPGIDDAIMLALASVYSDQLEVIGISSVAGNQTSQHVTENALRLSEFLNLDCPVVRGVTEPLIQPMRVAENVHGICGLGDVVLPDTKRQLASEKGVEYMAKVLMASEEKVTLVPTGPLTNIALLLKMYPEVKEKIEEMVIMGGGSLKGNATPMAEFNIYTDPEAAKIVFNSQLPITLASLDVTHLCGLRRDQVKTLLDAESEKQQIFGQMLQFYFNSDAYFDLEEEKVHDASCIIYLVHPEIFTGMQVSVDVDCNQGINRGMTVCDKRDHRDLSKCNVNLLQSVDNQKWQEIVLTALRQF